MRNYQKCLLVILLFLFISLIGCSSKWENINKKAERLCKNGNYTEAIRITKNALISEEKKEKDNGVYYGTYGAYYATLSNIYYKKHDYKRSAMFARRFSQWVKYTSKRFPKTCPRAEEKDIIKGIPGMFLKVSALVFSLCFLLFILYFLYNLLVPYRKCDLDYVIENINFLDNILDKFQIRYKEWLDGFKFEKIEFVDSLAYHLRDKRLKKYISRNVYMRIEEFMNILTKFNQNNDNLDIYKEKEEKENTLELIKIIHDYCQTIKSKVIDT